MQKSEIQIIKEVALKWNSFGGRIASHVSAEELPLYLNLVERGILKIISRMGKIKVYSLTKIGWEALPKNTQTYIKEKLKQSKIDTIKSKRFSHVNDYMYERQSPFYHRMSSHKFCQACFNSTKNDICEVCNNNTSFIDVRARVPKKNASKQKWRSFLTLFQPDVLDNLNWWNERNARL